MAGVLHPEECRLAAEDPEVPPAAAGSLPVARLAECLPAEVVTAVLPVADGNPPVAEVRPVVAGSRPAARPVECLPAEAVTEVRPAVVGSLPVARPVECLPAEVVMAVLLEVAGSRPGVRPAELRPVATVLLRAVTAVRLAMERRLPAVLGVALLPLPAESRRSSAGTPHRALRGRRPSRGDSRGTS